jgi:DNA-3-methyladenine glycosylase II
MGQKPKLTITLNYGRFAPQPSLANLSFPFPDWSRMSVIAPAFSFDLAEATKHLSSLDERLKILIAETSAFQLHDDHLASPYEALLEAITHQSISGKAARTIFARIVALGSHGRVPTPEQLLKLRKSALRKAGLSNAKILAAKDLARKTISGVVPSLEDARKLTDEELVERLTSVRGIGSWTVEMFLIFRLGRPDVLPIHDLGVKKGWSITYGKKHMPKPKELLAFGERWRPYRTLASWYMWRACQRAGHAAMRQIRPAKTNSRGSQGANVASRNPKSARDTRPPSKRSSR